MKAKLLLFAVFFCVTAISYSQNEFITTWKTDNPGTSNATSITIPINESLAWAYNYDVDWTNDGTFDDFGVTGDITHDYGVTGTYVVAIRGNFPQIFFNNSGDKNKIISIDQWGDIVWMSMTVSFYGCTNLISNATDAPDLSNVNGLFKTFADTSSFNGDLSNWDVSSVFDMRETFSNSAFNGDISNWNVSKVNNMRGMFFLASSFNGDLSSWDVSKVTDMGFLFFEAAVFNQDISGWDISSVTTMYSMFNGATAFNQDIRNWDVSNVTDMNSMFNGATAFNQDIGNWDVSSVTNMYSMFNSAAAFNQDIGNWNVSSVTNIYFMFDRATAFNQNIGNWDVSSMTNMQNVFSNSAFNGDISNWNVSSVTNMRSMFYNSAFNRDLSSWDVSSVTNMYSMFNSAADFNQDIGSWDVSNVTDMQFMFYGVTLSTANYDALLNGWNALTLQNGVDFNAGSSKYCNGEVARNNMISTFGWTITDLGLDCTGLSTDSFNVNALKIYPNPSTGMVYLKNTTGDFVQVYNVLGQEVYKAAINSNQETQELNLNHLQTGLYIAKISDALHSTTERIIIE